MVEVGLDDPHQTAIYIPHQEADANEGESYTLFPGRDLPNGYELRLAAYRTAWSKCLARIQELIHALHAPIVDKVAELVNKAYTDTLPGLPYAELPVISVTAFGASSSIFDEISLRLEVEGQDGLFDDNNGTHIVTHVFPQDCSNITSAMKTLITGFINKTEEELDSVKRKPSTSLSVVDISLFQVWFDAICDARGTDRKTTRLVVILHDFEQFEPLVIQDLFEICSLAIPRLPLVFVLSLSSPPTPSYIHGTYPRSTLSRLQVRSCSFSTGQNVLHDILLKTFFDVEFNPYLLLGPATLEFLVDFFGRHSPSLEGLMSILQLAHMKHFEDPLTSLLTEDCFGPNVSVDLADPTLSSDFFNSIFLRVRSLSVTPNGPTSGLPENVEELLELVQIARSGFQKHSKSFRVSFQLFLSVQRFMVRLGHKPDNTLPELMCIALRGRLGTSYKYLCSMIEKLQGDQLDNLLSDLHGFFSYLPSDVQREEEEIISRINTARSYGRHDNDPDEVRKVAESVEDWLLEYFQRRLVTFEDLPLWDIWYTGSTPFPSELLNPSLRASIFTGLLHPQYYCAATITDNYDEDADDDEALCNMPDTSILFHRYQESGRMINVFDWFESFTVVLEAQKERMRKEATVDETPSRRKGKRRQIDEAAEESEEQLEKWRMEIQARFIRSLHELDYVGFIKHTGRKADHVMRTVFDVPS